MLDITTLAAWGEFLGGIAVVASLIYLAGQIRSNTKTVRASNYNHLMDKNEEFNTTLMDAGLASLWLHGLDDFEGLSAEDQLRFNGLMSKTFNAAQRAWNFHEQGLLNDQMFEAQVRPVAVHLESVGARQWWDANQHWWPGDFREFVRERAAA